MAQIDFDIAYKELTGNDPFPWQRDLYENWFSQGKFPDACVLPTGLGKTSVIAVWLIALANGKPVPRRLVYVVNRRTVVDQTTDEVVKIRDRITGAWGLRPRFMRGSPKLLPAIPLTRKVVHWRSAHSAASSRTTATGALTHRGQQSLVARWT